MGNRYDTKNAVWLQGRQVWMLSKIYNRLGGGDTAQVYLEGAHVGAKFLRKHAKTEGNRLYFCLTREGNPVYLQRKMLLGVFLRDGARGVRPCER